MNIELVRMAMDALKPVQDYFDTVPAIEIRDYRPKSELMPYFAPDLKKGLMRLDYELTAESMTGNNSEDMQKHVSRLMTFQMANDFADLLENGDTESTNPLLKAFDGALKRKTMPVNVFIDYAHHFRYYAPKKDSYEYTVFVRLGVEWPV